MIWFLISMSLWIEIKNIYFPNTTSQQTHFDPILINPSSLSIIVGNFNGHSHLWDHVLLLDAQGDKIMDWIINKDLDVLNDSSANHTSCITRNDSTLDLSLCSHNWSIKTSWSLERPIGDRSNYQFPSSSTKASDINHSSEGGPGDAAMKSTGPPLPKRLNNECINFQKSLTFLFISHNSTTS